MNAEREGKLIAYFPSGEIDFMVDTFRTAVFGNRFEFSKNGELSKYSFQVDSIHSTYSVLFDSTGKVISYEGNPLVYKFVSFDDVPDSVLVKYSVSTFMEDSVRLSVKDSESGFENLTLSNHKRLSHVKVAKYVGVAKGRDRILIITKLECLNQDKGPQVFMDTIDFSKKK